MNTESGRSSNQEPLQPLRYSSSEEGPAEREPAPSLAPQRTLYSAWKRFSGFVKIGTTISSFLAFLLLAVPKVSVTPSVNLDLQDPLGTQFLVKNEGHVPVFAVSFGCAIKSEQSDNKVVGEKISAADSLWPGSESTRGCRIQTQGRPKDVKVDVFVDYYWPFYIHLSRRVIHFVGVHGPSGYFLIPDAIGRR